MYGPHFWPSRVRRPSAIAFAQASGVRAGQWEIAITIHSVPMPKAPPQVAAMMKGKTTRMKHCISAAEAARGPQDLMKSDKACTFPVYSMAGGKLRSKMVCKRDGGTMTAVSTGSFTPDSFTASGRTTSTGAMPMTMTATTTGKRIGPCKK